MSEGRFCIIIYSLFIILYSLIDLLTQLRGLFFILINANKNAAHNGRRFSLKYKNLCNVFISCFLYFELSILKGLFNHLCYYLNAYLMNV